MKNKVVVVTGASSGIGKACATFFASKEVRLYFLQEVMKRLKSISDSLNEKGYDTTYIVADVCKESDCRRLIHETLERYKKIDVLINNAGVSMRAILEDLELSVFEKVMRVNFFGTVYCTKYALPHILTLRVVLLVYHPLLATKAYLQDVPIRHQIRYARLFGVFKNRKS